MSKPSWPVDPETGEALTDSVEAWKAYFRAKYAPNGGIAEAEVAAVQVVDEKTLEVVFYNATGEYTEMVTVTLPEPWRLQRRLE